MLKSVFTLLILCLIFPPIVKAATSVSITSSYTTITAGEEFKIDFNITGVDFGEKYFAKAVSGDSGCDVNTLNGSWLSCVSSWTSMPEVVVATESAKITARFKTDVAAGTKDLWVRIKKATSDTTYNSAMVSIFVITPIPTPSPTPDPPTSTPSPSPTVTNTPTATPTKSPTPKPATPKPTPKLTPTSDSTITPEGQVLGLLDPTVTPSPTPVPVEDGKSFPIAAVLLIGGGIIFFVLAFLSYNYVRGQTQTISS